MWQNDVLRVLAVGELATEASKPAEKWFWCCLSCGVRKMDYTERDEHALSGQAVGETLRNATARGSLVAWS